MSVVANCAKKAAGEVLHRVVEDRPEGDERRFVCIDCLMELRLMRTPTNEKPQESHSEGEDVA